MQPVCNRFLSPTANEEYLHPLSLGQCSACGVVQIIEPVPANSLTPPYGWITYNEPEGHLGQLADAISSLPEVTKASAICGVSFFDKPLLKILAERGFENVRRIDMQEDLGINNPRAGVETIQDRLDEDAVISIKSKRGASDIVIASYILEHAHDLQRFLGGLKELVSPNGYIVIQVPDCERVMNRCDYSAIWEEHVFYFTSATLRNSLINSGLRPLYFERVNYKLEDCLVVILQRDEQSEFSPLDETVLSAESRRAESFAETFGKHRQRLKRFLDNRRSSHSPVALFGAGHRACTFVNLLELGEHLEFIIDDDPHKQGLCMPGSGLPILQSSALLERGIKLCLLSLSPESETKVVSRNQAFIDQGGTFLSIYPDSERAIEFSG